MTCKDCHDCIHDELCNVQGYVDPDECSCFRDNENFVEVVRCKDCTHYDEVGECEVHPHDGRFNVNYFCADGEMKDE